MFHVQDSDVSNINVLHQIGAREGFMEYVNLLLYNVPYSTSRPSELENTRCEVHGPSDMDYFCDF